MRRIMILLAYVGTVTFAGAVALTFFALDFLCYDMCPPESDLAATLSDLMARWIGTWLPGMVLFGIAWVLCLILLARNRHWVWLVAVLLAPAAGVGLAVLAAFHAADGHLFPTTWYVHGSWGAQKWLAFPPLLLGPLATILAGHVLRPRRAQLQTI